MTILLCVPTPEEMFALIPQTRELNQDRITDQMFFNLPERFKSKVSLHVLVTGVGPINAALTIGQALQKLFDTHTDLTHVLIAGLAGAHNLETHPLGSFCLVTEEIWPEYGLHDGHEVVANAFKWPQWAQSPQGPIYDRLKLDDLSAFNLKPHVLEQFPPVSSLTVAGVTASFMRVQNMWDRYHAPLENMEGFAIAYGCLRQKIPCTEIRCISNKIGPRQSHEKDFDLAYERLGTLLPTLNLF
ncbi:MAG: futalosine hydrolase [Desulfovibrionaceae bacterium]|nr:futalosine hydrolase [Desulfovibrionaceae bacterium]